MKRFYLTKLAMLVAILSCFSLGTYGQAITTTFTYLTGVSTFTVMPGTFSVTVDMQGAKGGDGATFCTPSTGGPGVRVQCTIATTPGQVLTVMAGQAGPGDPGSGTTGNAFGGGGKGYQYGGGGGGGSSIFFGSTPLAVAAGGGGGSYDCCSEIGGAGGTTAGAAGIYCSGNDGLGGTQSAGGAAGTNCGSGTAGTFGVGGNGGTCYSGGGGGGGYYGGGGSGGYGGGGGGSSYANPGLTSSVTMSANYNTTGNGVVIITPNCTPPTNGAITGTTLLCGVGAVAPLATTSTAGGTWSSTNSAVATITNLGVIQSVAAGTTIISYTNIYTCGRKDTFVTVTVAANPNNIFVPGAVCAGSTITLTDGTAGGTYSISNPLLGSIVSTTGVLTGLAGGIPTVTYTMPSGCLTTTTVTINTSPLGISGFPSVCQLSSVTLSDGTPGGIWSSSGTGVATVGTGSGTVLGVNPGSTAINYTLGSGCKASVNFTVNVLPSPFPVSPSAGDYCLGGSGVNVTMTPSTFGINYQLYLGSTIVGSPVPGTGSVVNFGNVTAAGVYTVVGINPTTGCSRNMTGSSTITIDPLPIGYPISAGGGYCDMGAGSGLDVSIPTTDGGILYQLFLGGTPIGSPLLGGSGAIDFGLQTAGCYTVLALNTTSGCSSVMPGTSCVVANPLPDVFNVTPALPAAYCDGGLGVRVGLDFSDPGATYQLYNGTAIGAPVRGSSSAIDFGYQTLGGTYTVIATNTLSGCTNDMAGSASVSINPLPTPHTIMPAGTTSSYCAGTGGVDLVTDNSDGGINYQLYHGTTMIGSVVNGTGTGGIDFGSQTAAGTYTAVAIDALTGCSINMLGSVNVSINALPAIHNMSPGGGYCAGGTGTDVFIDGSNIGVSYQLYYNSSMVGMPSMAGTGAAVHFGLQTGDGIYTVVATNTTTGCTSNMAGAATVVINPLPASFDVTGGGNFCAGSAGVHVGLDFSGLGINYQLYRGTDMVGSSASGLGSGLDFGSFTTPGSYTVIGTNAISGCSSNMAGYAIVNMNALPYPFPVTGNGSYCAGGTGRAIGLAGSSTSVSYQLFNSGAVVGSPVTGTGIALNYGLMTDAGVYTIVGTDNVTGCVNTMGGAASISINPLPTQFLVTGGGNYCTGGTGVHVGLNASSTGVSYQLYNGADVVGPAMAGIGGALDFGTHTAAGTYTVMASNVTTGCVNTMNGDAMVAINALPTAFTVTGGGSYCATGIGVHVGLSNSVTGVNYQLFNGATGLGTVTGLSGTPVDFGLTTTAGTYTVHATNPITTCVSNMTGSTVVGINSLPTVYSVLGGATFCEGAGAAVMLNGSARGVTYQLYDGGPVGPAVSGTGSAISFGTFSTGGTYTVVAMNTATTCTNNMNGSAVLTVNPKPNPYDVTGGGSFCASGTGVLVGLIGSGSGINYQLYNGTTPVDLPIGGTGGALNFGLQTAGGTYTIMATNTATHCSQEMSSSATVTVIPTVTPSITISSDLGTTVCPGLVNNFTSATTFGGSAPIYSWMVNGVYMGGMSTFSYVPVNNDVVTATLTSNATCPSTPTVSTSETITVRTYELPSVSIAANTGTTICPGTSVTFTATPLNGGTAPVYDWFVNNVLSGNGSSYTYHPAAGDVLSFLMVSNEVCRTTDSVFSNDLTMNIETPVAPVFTITSHLGPIIGVGQVDTFRALVTNLPGISLTYQWYVNSELIHGATGDRYISSTIFNKDSVYCVVTAANSCGGASGQAYFNVYLMNLAVNQVTGGASDLIVVPNPTKGDFTVKGSMKVENDEKVSLEITNMLGQVVYTENIATQNGTINQHVTPSTTLANGMYILSLRTGSDTKVFHLVIEQ